MNLKNCSLHGMKKLIYLPLLDTIFVVYICQKLIIKKNICQKTSMYPYSLFSMQVALSAVTS